MSPWTISPFVTGAKDMAMPFCAASGVKAVMTWEMT
jgi:hypothetical protein